MCKEEVNLELVLIKEAIELYKEKASSEFNSVKKLGYDVSYKHTFYSDIGTPISKTTCDNIINYINNYDEKDINYPDKYTTNEIFIISNGLVLLKEKILEETENVKNKYKALDKIQLEELHETENNVCRRILCNRLINEFMELYFKDFTTEIKIQK